MVNLKPGDWEPPLVSSQPERYDNSQVLHLASVRENVREHASGSGKIRQLLIHE